MPTYPTPHIEWGFNIPSSPSTGREIKTSLDGIDANSEIASISDGTGFFVGTASFGTIISAGIQASLALLTPAPDLSINFEMNGDGYMQVVSLDDGDVPFWLHPSGLMTMLGFGEASVEIGVGETYVFPRHPKYMWHPRMVTQRDTGNVPDHVSMTSETITKRPVEIVHSDDWEVRTIRWQTVAACLVHKHRAADENFAQAAPKVTGDLNNTLQGLCDYIRLDEENSYEHPYVWVANIDGTYSGPYTLNLTRSKMSGGIKDEAMLYTETAMESYTVELYLRKDT